MPVHGYRAAPRVVQWCVLHRVYPGWAAGRRVSTDQDQRKKGALASAQAVGVQRSGAAELRGMGATQTAYGECNGRMGALTTGPGWAHRWSSRGDEGGGLKVGHAMQGKHGVGTEGGAKE